MYCTNQADDVLFEREIEQAQRDKARSDAEKARHEAEKAKFEAEHEKEKMAKTQAETEKTKNSNRCETLKAVAVLLGAVTSACVAYQKFKSD